MSGDAPGPTGDPTPYTEDTNPYTGDPTASPGGADLVREALDRARADGAARRADAVAAERSGASAQARGRRRAAGRESRVRDKGEPMTFGSAIDALIAARGWAAETAAVSVLTAWPELVGADIARHATAVSVQGGVLTVQAESTAWATQLRLLSRQLLDTVQQGAGPGVITRLEIKAPTAPSWRRGSRRVKGAGPRDTYG